MSAHVETQIVTPRISAVIICKNEEHNIRACLESVKWCDEIVVVDSGSTDRTVEIAKEFTSKVLFHEWPGYVAQKNYALAQATGEWVISLDADERCTPELEKKIREILADPHAADGYKVRRHVYYLGRWINHCGWYPDWKLRVARRATCSWTGVDPHDKLVTQGTTKKLDADIEHYTYRDLSHQLQIIDKFSDVVRDEWLKAGKKPSLFLLMVHPWIKFLEVYLWKRGILDGRAGLIISMASAFYVFAKHAKLWEASRRP